jgi:uncharacterized membrane protein
MKNLENARVYDSEGALRLVFPTPGWDDIVDLALVEIRQYGAGSTQVARRLRALLEHLIDRLPPPRTAALRRELNLLEQSVARSFPEADDRHRASIGDFQGLGGSPLRSDV